MRKVLTRSVVVGAFGAALLLGVPSSHAQEPPVEEPCIITGASGPLSTPVYDLGTGLGLLSGPVMGLGCALDTLGF